jgi:large subunit ribosomal protein L18
MQPRRRRLGYTDYHKRLALVKSGKPRLVVRKTSRYIIVQLVESRKGGDYTALTVTSRVLARFGWRGGTKNIPSAYLSGLYAGKLALARGYKEAIVDIGRLRAQAGSRIFAAVKGAVDAGLSINVDGEMFPSEERLRGEHIKDYFEMVRAQQAGPQFSALPQDFVSNLPQLLEEIKQRIMTDSADTLTT